MYLDNDKIEFNPVYQEHNRVLIIGGGESLIGFDMNQLLDFKGAIICVNNVVFHIPRADYWITVDPMQQDKPQYALRHKVKGVYYFCAYPDTKKSVFDAQFYKAVPGVHYLERIVPMDYEDPKIKDSYVLQEEKNKITTGDSCYGALGLAYHMGAREVIMLGVDAFGFGHWYDKTDPYNKGWGRGFKEYLDRIPLIYKQSVPQWKKRGAKIINGSRHSRIDCFERMDPQEAFTYFD